MTAPDDLTANYLAVMEQRGMTWGDLADEFDREARAGRALDGGANAAHMARWARSHEQAADERRAAHEDPEQREPRPDVADPAPPQRTATPPAPAAPSRRRA